MFVAASAVRAGFAGNKVATLSGDQIAVRDTDTVAIDLLDPNASTIVASLSSSDVPTWEKTLREHGVPITKVGKPEEALGQVRFEVAASVAATTSQLEHAGLWDARVEPVPHHYETTWATLKASSPAGLDVGDKTIIPDAQLDLVGIYVVQPIPGDAYALMLGERPADYWYVMWITVGLGLIGLVFAWALVRAVRRDLLPTRAA